MTNSTLSERCVNGDVTFEFIPGSPGYPVSKDEDSDAGMCKETIDWELDMCDSTRYENDCCASCQSKRILGGGEVLLKYHFG